MSEQRNLRFYFQMQRPRTLSLGKRSFSEPSIVAQMRGLAFSERDLLGQELAHFGLDHLLDAMCAESTDEDVLRIVRLLIRHREQRVSEENRERLFMLLSSPVFMDSVRVLAETIKGQDLELSSRQAWDCFPLIEPLMLLHPNKEGLAPLAQLEKRIIFKDLWQDEQIYSLLEEADLSSLVEGAATRLSSNEEQVHCDDEERHEIGQEDYLARKLLRYLARLLAVCSRRLGLSERAKQLSWHLLLQIVKDELSARWFLRRSVLSIVASYLYAVAMLLDEDRTFAQIIEAIYAHDLSPDRSWFKNIYVAEGRDPVDLVAFYNSHFLPRMQPLIRQLATLRPITRSSSDSEERDIPRSANQVIPFPSSSAGIARIAPNITLAVSPGRRQPLVGSTASYMIAGDLGLRLAERIPPSTQVRRRLDF